MNHKAYYGAAILQKLLPELQRWDRIIFNIKRIARIKLGMYHDRD